MTAAGRFAVGAVVWAFALAGDAEAQAALSLTSAVDAVLAANADIVVARTSVAEAEQRVVQARAGFLPRIDFTQSWQRGNQPVFVFGSLLAQRRFAEADFAVQQLNHPDATANARSAFSLDYALFDGGRTRAAVRAANLDIASARAGERQTRNDLALAATRAYGRVLRADAEAAAADAAVLAAEEDARTAEARREAGTATDADVLSMQVHLAELRARSIDGAGEKRIARAELNRMMNRPVESDIVLQQTTAAADTVPGSAAPTVGAATRRPELERAALAVDLADAMRMRARGSLLPEVAVQAAYEWNDGRRGRPVSSWVAGASVRLNVFSGGATLARMREAAHAAERARAERDRMARAIEVEVLTAGEQLAAARSRESLGRAAVLQARESQRIIRNRFEAGMAPTSDVLRAAMAVLDAESQRVRAIVDVMVGEAALKRALGDEEVHR